MSPFWRARWRSCHSKSSLPAAPNLAWLGCPRCLRSNEQGVNLVNIAQVFQRSGTLEVSFVDTGIESVDDFRGMRIGTWGFGNEHELFAAMRAADIDPENADDVTVIQQPFDMSLAAQWRA